MKSNHELNSEVQRAGLVNLFDTLTNIFCRKCLTILATIIFCAIFIPANASDGSGKNSKRSSTGNTRKSSCKAKAKSFSYPVIIFKSNKKSPANKKSLSRSKKRSYSFPV